MDKYEYKIKTEQIKMLYEKKDYETAQKIAESIDWERVKDSFLLSQLSEIYEQCGKLEESKEFLLMAYDYSAKGRFLLDRLVELCMKLNQFEEAQEFFEEYTELAPRDTGVHILKYKLEKARGASDEALILILEQLKTKELYEEWIYELAFLYQKIGDIEKCVELCEELVLWFRDGAFVVKALELKMCYEELSPSEQMKYDMRFEPKDEIHLPEENLYEEEPITELPYGDTADTAESRSELKQDDGEPEGGAEYEEPLEDQTVWNSETIHREYERYAPDSIENQEAADFVTQVCEEPGYQGRKHMPENTYHEIGQMHEIIMKDVVSEKYNTINLQEELAKGIQEIMNATEAETVDNTMKNLRRIVEDSQIINLPVELRVQEKKKGPDFCKMLSEDDGGQLCLYIPHRMKPEEQIPGQISIDDLIEERELSKKQAEEMTFYGEQNNLEHVKVRALKAAEEILDFLSDEVPDPPEPYFFHAGDQMNSDDFPIRKESEMPDINISSFLELEQQVIGEELKLEEDHSVKKKVREVHQCETERVPELLSEFTKPERAGDAEPVVQISERVEVELNQESDRRMTEEVIPNQQEAKSMQPEAVDLARSELYQAADYDSSPIEEEIGDMEKAEQVLKAYPDPDPEQKAEEEKNDAAGETVPQKEIMKFPGKMQKEEDVIEDIKKKLQIKLQEARQKAMDGIPVGAAEKMLFGRTEIKKELSEEERNIFTYFAPIEGMDREIKRVLNELDQERQKGSASSSGHLVITGNAGNGRTVLATDFVKALQKAKNMNTGKIAKVSAESLNRKNIREVLGKIEDGYLIIESAGSLSNKTVEKLNGEMQEDVQPYMLIMEDTRKNIKKMMERHPEFKERFTSHIHIVELTNDELVAFGKAYAQELKYAIDEMGVLALYNRIYNIQNEERPVTMNDVRGIIEDAIRCSERKRVKNLFSTMISNRYDKNDFVILKEKDFDAS